MFPPTNWIDEAYALLFSGKTRHEDGWSLKRLFIKLNIIRDQRKPALINII